MGYVSFREGNCSKMLRVELLEDLFVIYHPSKLVFFPQMHSFLSIPAAV